MFELKFSMVNDAFDNPATEIARILRKIARDVSNGALPEPNQDWIKIRDVNGNHIGAWRVQS